LSQKKAKHLAQLQTLANKEREEKEREWEE